MTTTPSPLEPSAPTRRDEETALFDRLPIGAYRCGPDGRFLRINAAMARLLGFASPQAAIDSANRQGADWYVEGDRQSTLIARALELDSLGGVSSEVTHRVTGQRLWIREHAHVVRDASGRVAFVEGMVEETTSRIKAEAAWQQRDALLRDVTAGLPGVAYRMVVLPDLTRRYEFVSDGSRLIYGIEPAAVLADPYAFAAARHPKDRAWVDAEMRRHLDTGEPTTIEFRIIPAGGTLKWVRLTSTATRLDDGSTRVHGVVIDVTRLKMAEEALRDNDRRWTRTLETLGDGVWDWDLSQDDCTMTGPLCDTYDTPAGSSCTPMCVPGGVIHPDDLPDMLAARQRHLDGVTPTYVHEHRIRRKDGQWVWVQSRGIVVDRDAEGRALRMIGTHTDITERRQAEALRQQRDRAHAADRAKSELMSRISHELRTPLNAILGYAQLLSVDTPADSAHREWADQLLWSGRLLLGLVDDVLDLTQGQSMQFALTLAPVPLFEVFESSRRLMSEPAKTQGVDLRAPEPGPALFVRADAKRLQQVLTNLLSNAIKYNRAGGTVDFGARRDGDEVVFCVADSGRGIPAERLSGAFQPFDRLGAEHGPIAGTGLGLALCRQLIEAMGGTIEVASEVDVGTTFTIRLPAAEAGTVSDPAPSTAPPPR